MLEIVDTKFPILWDGFSRRCPMSKLPYDKYSKELKAEAVRLITEDGMTAGKLSKFLCIPKPTVENWFRLSKNGNLNAGTEYSAELTEAELELVRVKRELAEVKMERDILKKAAAYFAKESL